MKAVSRDASLIPRYLARAICMYAKNFCVMLIHQVGFASQIFFPQNCLFITVSLLLWTDIAVECVWLFSRNPPDEGIDFLMTNFAILFDSQFYNVS